MTLTDRTARSSERRGPSRTRLLLILSVMLTTPTRWFCHQTQADDTSLPPAVTVDNPSVVSPAPASGAASGRGSVAFTQPYRTIELSAAEPGLVADLRIHRGSHVVRGEVLCELDVSALRAQRATVAHRFSSTSGRDALRVEMERLDRRLESLRALTRRGGGTPEELAAAEAEAAIAALKVRAADEELAGGQLALSEIDARIEARRVRAVMDGIITEVHRDVGEFVSSVDPAIATLVDLTRLRAAFFLPTDIVRTLRKGDTTTICFPDTQQQSTCVIEYVGPLTHADSGRVRVDVVIDNLAQEYRSGLQCVLPEIADCRPQILHAATPRSLFDNPHSLPRNTRTRIATGRHHSSSAGKR